MIVAVVPPLNATSPCDDVIVVLNPTSSKLTLPVPVALNSN